MSQRNARRLHRSITGDDLDLREQDPEAEALILAWMAELAAEQELEFGREQTAERSPSSFTAAPW